MNNKIKIADIINSSDLMKKNYAKLDWLVKDILPPGLSLIAGRPKSGKSFLALYLASILTKGNELFGTKKTKERNVLFISNEDSERRIKSRIMNSDINPKNLSFYFKPFYFNADYESELINIIRKNKTHVIVVDTLAKAISVKSSNKNQYFVEYEILGNIQNFCKEHNISIIFVHHTRKAQAINPIDKILGTTGISGAVDTIWLLEKDIGKHILQIEGKDVESREMHLKHNIFGNNWNLLDKQRDDMTPERSEIFDYLKKKNVGVKTSDIAKFLGKEKNSTSNLLKKMKEDGLIVSPKYGYYKINSEFDVSSES